MGEEDLRREGELKKKTEREAREEIKFKSWLAGEKEKEAESARLLEIVPLHC